MFNYIKRQWTRGIEEIRLLQMTRRQKIMAWLLLSIMVVFMVLATIVTDRTFVVLYCAGGLASCLFYSMLFYSIAMKRLIEREGKHVGRVDR